MKIKNIRQTIFYVMAVGASIFLLFFIITCSWIGYDVKDQCQRAQDRYKKDCVESLIGVLQNEDESFKARNSAIWALGQLGDSRALPVLQSYYTGNIPDREPLNGTISQYELKKAVNLTSGGLNISAPIWRNFFMGDFIKKSAVTEVIDSKTIKEQLEECLPKSDQASKTKCEEILSKINSFDECLAAGFLANEDDQNKCQTVDGRVFEAEVE